MSKNQFKCKLPAVWLGERLLSAEKGWKNILGLLHYWTGGLLCPLRIKVPTGDKESHALLAAFHGVT